LNDDSDTFVVEVCHDDCAEQNVSKYFMRVRIFWG
jgi:hypothetical protein